MLGLGITVGAGVWQLTGAASSLLAGPSACIAYIIAGFAATVAAACYGELAVAYPVAGGSFTYTMLTFGELPAWVTVMNQMSIWVFGSAALSRSFSSYLAILCHQHADFFIVAANADGSNGIDLMAGAVTVLCILLLMMNGRISSLTTTVLTMAKLVVVLVIIVITFTKADPSNLDPFFGTGDVSGMFAAVSLFIYTMTGFDSIANAAEEARDVNTLPLAMVLVPAIATCLYFLVALSFNMLLPVETISSLPTFLAGFTAAGLHYMVYIVSTAAVIGSFTGLLVGLYTGGRLIMVVGRDWLLPPVFARISRRTQTPVIAQVVLGALTALISLFASFQYLTELVNFGQMLSMLVVINAQLFRRYYPGIKLRFTKHGTVESMQQASGTWVPGSRLHISLKNRRRLVVLHLILISLAALGLAMSFTPVVRKSIPARTVLCIVWTCVLLGCTLSMHLLCPLYYEPNHWHIRAFLLPWLPMVSIAIIMFGLMSVAASSWYKIGIYNGIILVFYLVFSLPMSYIKHYKLDFDMVEQLDVVQYTFVDGRWRPVQNRKVDGQSTGTLPNVDSVRLGTPNKSASG
ncbi:hypothetical protein QBZ16_004406 [Prototheca wickerhamii]|uniref:Uncharacterized protein n=1 Tax=Prototheca wickerhamii TaxID=3111 RepID=A0AAD9IH88_PROWI|nr:hypothetical protein QBZ16_004406 [Prototheca wickerhamii]